MPTSGRSPRSGDRADQKDAPRDGERATTHDVPIQPPQYFDPAEPWDAEAAEALTRLYESGEGYLHKRAEDELLRRRQTPHAEASPDEPAAAEGAWLEARLSEMAERLQKSLAEMNPERSAEHLNRRLDAIEERFSEALAGVVRRSDLDGLKLIEAQVMELTAHIQETRTRLDRIDAIDERVQGLARRIEEADLKRLDALEKMLQDYMADWRKSDERTASALHNMEGIVSRVGESIEAMEAQKPAPDLGLSLLGTGGLGDTGAGRDPLSQVYAEAARLLEPVPSGGSTLDAADYVPKAEPAADEDPLPPHDPATPPDDRRDATPENASLPSPKLRALARRANLRQAQLLDPQPDAGNERAGGEAETAATPDKASKPARGIRSGLFLTGAITLFAAIGYLLVDVLMATSPAAVRPAETKQSARAGENVDRLSSAPKTEGAIGERKAGRIDALSSVMAAAFRGQEAPLTPDDLTPAMATLPMTIGPASLRQAAMRGEAAAQVEVAARFAAGHGVTRDLQQAVHWYSRAAAQGSALAQYRLGALYEAGLGTNRDVERARVWYARAARQGNINAMHNLAVLSVSGGRSDYAAAAKWFTEAADFGLADSQVNLAILYQKGLGVPQDLAQAYKWLALAARGGDSEAASRIPQIKGRLSAAELQAADAAIAAWRSRTPDAAANETTAASLDSR